jgi:hypothetical protein
MNEVDEAGEQGRSAVIEDRSKDEQTYTVAEAAVAYGKGEITIRRKIEANKFPNAYQDGKTKTAPWRIPASDLEAQGWTLAVIDLRDQLSTQDRASIEEGSDQTSDDSSEQGSDESRALIEEEKLRAQLSSEQEQRRELEMKVAVLEEREAGAQKLVEEKDQRLADKDDYYKGLLGEKDQRLLERKQENDHLKNVLFALQETVDRIPINARSTTQIKGELSSGEEVTPPEPKQRKRRFLIF